MANIEKLLRKRTWTGRELGILEVANMAIVFRQALQGVKEPKFLFTREKFIDMMSTINTEEQMRIYNGYISIHEWLSLKYNIARSYEQQAEYRVKTLFTYIKDAITAEDIFLYINSLPVVMTEKQYNETQEWGREAWLKNDDGTDKRENITTLLYRAVRYYLEKLAENPAEDNPLKPIRKKYLSEAIANPYILSRYNDAAQRGYYTLKDGRRSDKMTDAEWKEAVNTKEIRSQIMELCKLGILGSGFYGTTSFDIAMAKLGKKKNLHLWEDDHEDGTKLEQIRQAYGSGETDLQPLIIWHTYKDAPQELSKWEVIESEGALRALFLEAEDQEKAATVFCEEFSELSDILLQEIDRCLNTSLHDTPAAEWASTTVDRSTLYNAGFFGIEDEMNFKTAMCAGNVRAVMNGIAVLKPSRELMKYSKIDEDGYYIPPKIEETIKGINLQSFLPESPSYEHNIDDVLGSRKGLSDSIYLLNGYNTAIELISKAYDIPEIDVFKRDLDIIKSKVDALNELVPLLSIRITAIEYEDEELKQKKLQVLHDYFQPIDYEALTAPKKAVKQAETLLKDFSAFKEKDIANLLFYRPDDTGKGGNE